MAKNNNRSNFSELLRWLDSSSEDAAAREYERIRGALIRFFLAKGCSDAEDLTDTVFDRVDARIPQIKDDYTGEKSLYFLKVARFIRRERLLKKEISIGDRDFAEQKTPAPLFSDDNDEYSETEKRCLKRCFNKLKVEHQNIILDYYEQDGKEKILSHKNLAAQKAMTANALRNQVYRVKMKLSECVKNCVGNQIS